MRFSLPSTYKSDSVIVHPASASRSRTRSASARSAPRPPRRSNHALAVGNAANPKSLHDPKFSVADEVSSPSPTSRSTTFDASERVSSSATAISANPSPRSSPRSSPTAAEHAHAPKPPTNTAPTPRHEATGSSWLVREMRPVTGSRSPSGSAGQALSSTTDSLLQSTSTNGVHSNQSPSTLASTGLCVSNVGSLSRCSASGRAVSGSPPMMAVTLKSDSVPTSL